ncbi:toxin C-terminal domain-containing protein [Pseudoalteromonas viridis]|uniref:Toxin C-terminal domain-containing protein n=1 Tax=Pseudoalteromonas viridis TaxID=339617 RepID=A0ABX7VCX1_9GAMM|nr:toxin C-terminal domain-containing protein [Pseudoalteromonas viridis]QTL37632.1 toxin C-terminal domain-containing protein [Pseudoalteromonas viridis]
MQYQDRNSEISSRTSWGWKMANSEKALGSKKSHMGTYNADLKWIGK